MDKEEISTHDVMEMRRAPRKSGTLGVDRAGRDRFPGARPESGRQWPHRALGS